jgi:antitoxin VapB
MAVNLKNPEAERLLTELAERTGQSLTEAATQAFRERLARLNTEASTRRERTERALLELVREARQSRDTGEPLKPMLDELWETP